MKSKIVQIGVKKLVGKSMRMSLMKNQTFKLWKDFMPRRKEIKNQLHTDLYSMQIYDSAYFNDFNPNIEFTKWAAVEVSSFDDVPDGMNSYVLKGGIYAVFLHVGSSQEFPRTMQYILGKWLPESEYQLDDREHFELLGEKYKNNDPASEEEVWIPIKRSESISQLKAEEYPLSFNEINPDAKKRMEEISNDPTPIILLLDGLEDARNLGAIYRLADACRITRIFTYKPNQSINQSKISRVSRQTMDHISYTELHSKEEVIELTKEYTPIALEYTNKSISFNTYKQDAPCMLVIGNERSGVSPELLEICKASLHIPMLGQNSSMNVSVATGIVLYHLLGNMRKI